MHWSPATHADFPEARRKQAAALGAPLLLHRIWNAAAVPEGRSEAVRDEWIDFVPRYVEAATRAEIRPISRAT